MWPKVEFNEHEGWDMIRPEIYRESIYADCSNEDIALAYALLTPEPRGPDSPTNSPVTTTSGRFGRIPRVYIEFTQDQAVSWSLQKRMYTATPCERVKPTTTPLFKAARRMKEVAAEPHH